MQTTIFTCSIYPDVTRLWYHFVDRFTQPAETAVLIYDCGAGLDSVDFPRARIFTQPNIQHGLKIDHALATHVKTPLLFIIDDDTFLTTRAALAGAGNRLAADARLAAYSFYYRPWWQFRAKGRRVHPMGTYAVVVKPEIIRREGLSFATRWTLNPFVRRGRFEYDTADYMHRELLRRGYAVEIAPEEIRQQVPTFFGTSTAYCRFTIPGDAGTRQVKGGRAALVRQLAHDCGIYPAVASLAATASLYRHIFGAEPRLSDIPTLPELRALLATLPSEENRQWAAAQLDRLQANVSVLENSAGL